MELLEHEVAEELLDDLKIVQDKRYYRFTSDSVLLTRFARPKAKDVVADFCSGSGVVAFHFYAINRHLPFESFTLFELQKPLADLSKKTIELNGFGSLFKVENRPIQEIGKEYLEKFSLVLCNPPYEKGGFDNDTYEKAICRKELTITLKEIAEKAAYVLKFGGRLAIINRADRLAELCYTLHSVGIEVKRIQLVQGKENDKPYLVMVEGVKGGKPCSQVLCNLVNEKKG